MANTFDEYLKRQKVTPAVLVGQNTGSSTSNGNGLYDRTISYDDWVKNGYSAGPSDGKGKITLITGAPAVEPPSNDPKFSNDYWDNVTWGTYETPKTTTSTGTSSGGTSSAVPAYKSTLDDLYNKVMGYGGYSAGTYTPGAFNSSVDTTGIQGQLNGWLNEIDNYEPFKYDLNADMLYQQALDNYIMKGQLAMQDTMGAATGLTGGYGNSYAASVGNQAYQQHITQANNMIPQFQQMAMDVWQSGLDQLLSQYNAGSMQLNNLLSIEAQELAAWQAQEALNFDAWSANEQNAYNEWLAGYSQAQDQYELAKDYYATLEAMQKASGGSGGGSSSKTSGKTSSNDNKGFVGTVQDVAAALGAVMSNPTVNWVELLDKANTKK